MKRRHFIQTVAALSATPAALAQQPTTRPESEKGRQEVELTVADATAETVPGFFNDEQFATLKSLGDILMPSMNGAPGASEAGAAEFLDFLIGQSPRERQRAYLEGLNALNAESKHRFEKPFSEISTQEAAQLLAPLREPWKPESSNEPLLRFLRTAKDDVRTATVNSREWINAFSEDGRRPRGVGMYWYTIE